ncbi:MAG: hypothetical protein KTR31_30165 [Myxococcales bacterium]|nr:hypothetical protein [Myxococcales bacterium]
MSRVVVIAMGTVACNTGLVDYTEPLNAPGRTGNWTGPREWCEGKKYQADDDVVIDGFYLCTDKIPVHPIDDPILHPCNEITSLQPDDEVAWLYDGVVAKAYAIEALHLREGVHDDLRGIPIFVDW